MTEGHQHDLFPPPLVTCSGCGWSWRDGDAPPPVRVRECAVVDDAPGATSAGMTTTTSAPEDEAHGAARPMPLKKWRCALCGHKFPCPRAERVPVCHECSEGQPLLFGERRDLKPAGFDPLGNPRKLHRQGKRGSMRRDRAKRRRASG